MTKTRGFLYLAVFAIFTVSLSGEAFAQKVLLRSQIVPSCANSGNLKFADIYADGNIVVQGSYNCRGVFIYNISNPDAPVLSSWYNPGANQQFLEAIVIGNRGYFGSGNGGGVHIVDLTNPASPVLLGVINASIGGGFNSIHEMVVFQQNGINYLIENFNGFSSKILKVINVSNPAAPVFIRDINPTEVSWVHAMHIRGNRMFTSGWGNSTTRAKTEIYDITNVGTQTPALLGFISDPSSVTGGNSMHSSWSSEDGNFLYSARETSNGNGDIRVYNISDPAVPLLVNSLTMNGLKLNAVTPHNPVVVGNYLYVAWYQAGIQIFDISIPSQPKRVGQYDTFPNAFSPSEEEQAAFADAEPWDMICGSDFQQNSLPTTYDGAWAVFPMLGIDKVLAGDLKYGLTILDASQIAAPNKNIISDFDGDGKTDFSVYTPATGQWITENSSNGGTNAVNWGLPGDIIAAGDYDGDGKTDRAVWRPSNGTWYVVYSSGFLGETRFGLTGDVPAAADYDADGKTDFAVWRPSNGTWYILQSTLGYRQQQWGLNGDKVLTGDYEGDGKADLAVWRPSNGTWYIIRSSSSIAIIQSWGLNGDKPLFADFDGDGQTELTVYRPTETNWYIFNSITNAITIYPFGFADDTPIPADYDGDGKADIAVYRPGTNVWYRVGSVGETYNERLFGSAGDKASPSSVQPQ
ncbi:MAG: FG-GAP-like repeat-containing protein [Pyrinomonadaceae bacterium]